MLGRRDEATHTVRRALALIESEIAERPDNVHAIVQGAWALAYLGERKRAQEYGHGAPWQSIPTIRSITTIWAAPWRE